MRERKRGEG